MNPDRDHQDPPLDAEAVTELLRAIAEAGWDEARLTADGTTLVYSRSSAIPTLTATSPATADSGASTQPEGSTGPAASPAKSASPAAERGAAPDNPGTRDAAPAPVDGHTITAPSLGLFWRSPQPGAPPFVDVGDEIDKDATVCIVEVMKLMNHVKAEMAGRVVAIYPENGEMVEFGTPLVTIEPT